MRSFGTELNRFALAVSLIDRASWEQFKSLIEDYLLNKIRAHYFELMTDGVRVARRPGMEVFWSSTHNKSTEPIFNDDGEYYGMRAFAYHRDQSLWITAKDKGTITRPDCELEDSGRLRPELPRYQDTEGLNLPTRTAVIVPMRFANRVFGVFVIEHPEHKPWTEPAHEEIQLAVLSLARIVSVERATEEQLDSVRKAFASLQGAVDSLSPALDKPKVFVASSSNSDETVISLIREVLNEYSTEFDVKYWKDFVSPGQITREVAKQIVDSRFGIVYLSERIDSTSPEELPYTDNGNVLFEAGMLHALSENKDLPARGWIPIREDSKVAGNPPFDIAQERMVIVPRVEAGVNSEAFKTSLRSMIDSLKT